MFVAPWFPWQLLLELCPCGVRICMTNCEASEEKGRKKNTSFILQGDPSVVLSPWFS